MYRGVRSSPSSGNCVTFPVLKRWAVREELTQSGPPRALRDHDYACRTARSTAQTSASERYMNFSVAHYTWLKSRNSAEGRHQITSPELGAAVALAPKARFCTPAVSWALAALITCATAIYVGRTQGDPKNVLFTIAVIGALGALGALIAGILLASFSVAVLVALLGGGTSNQAC